MAKFKIYGDYGYRSESLLEEFDLRSEAERWVEKWCGDGDFAGHEQIEIAFFAEDGEYVSVKTYRAEDYRDETVWYEGDDDFALIEEF
jgi:hypothetical protein